jgi:signal peptidase
MMKKKFKKALGIFQALLTIVLVLAVLLLVFTAFNPMKNYRFLRVMSGSMEPTIKTGAVVLIQKVAPESLRENDIITFGSAEDPNLSITHRLVKIEEKEGETVFKTRGDANNSEDINEVSPADVQGKVIFSLPLLGYLAVFIKEPLGFGLLVVLPAILIIISEILNIKKAIEEEVEKKYAKENLKKSPDEKITGLLIFLLFLGGIFLAQSKPTNAYFSDTVVVEGNTFSMASDWTTPPPPAPARVVINEVYYDVDSAHQSTGTENHNEWIELYNAGPDAIDISGWIIEDSGPAASTDVIPSTPPIPADTFVVITPSSSTWNYWPSIPSGAVKIVLTSTDTKIGNGLNNEGDRVILRDSGRNVVDAISYGNDNSVWDPGCPSVATGHSLARSSKGYDTNQPGDFVDLATPNPGTNPHPPKENKKETIAWSDLPSFVQPKAIPELDFYLEKEKAAVGFRAVNISQYKSLDYQVLYQTDGIEKGIDGQITLQGENEVGKSGLLLGTCSQDVCVYDQKITKIDLNVKLREENGKETSLSKSLNLENQR